MPHPSPANNGPIGLRAPASAPTTPAPITRTIPRHNAAAEAARRSVAQIDDPSQRIRRVQGTRLRASAFGLRLQSIHLSNFRRLRADPRQLRPQILKQKLLLPSQKPQLQPAEDVVHDRLGKPDVGIASPPARLKPRMRELFAQQLQRHAMLQRNGRSQRKAIHQPRDRRSFLGHGDEQLARLPIRIEPDGDVTLMPSDIELVRDRSPFLLQLMPNRARRRIQIVFLWSSRSPRVFLRRVGSLSPSRRKRLRLLAPIPINRNSLQSKLPGLKISLRDVFHRSILRKIHGLRYSPRDKRLRSRHHPQMPHVSNRPSPLSRLERAIKHSQMLILNMRRPFDSPRSINVTNNRVSLIVIVPKLEQSRRHSLINNLNHPPTHQLLVLNQSQIRLHSSSVTVHHEAYCSCRGQDRYLTVPVAVFFALGQGFVPALFAGFVESAWDITFVDVVYAGAVHSDHVQEWFAIYVPAGAGSSGHVVGFGNAEASCHCVGCGG